MQQRFFIILTIALALSGCVSIQQDEVGVLWKRFDGGTVLERTYTGKAFVAPWNKMEFYRFTEQGLTRAAEVLSAEGKPCTIGFSVFWELKPETIPSLHKEIGPDYKEKVVIPIVESYLRKAYAEGNLNLTAPAIQSAENRYIHIQWLEFDEPICQN